MATRSSRHYNNIFHSPGFGETALRDPRFLPHSVLDIWRYPLYWLLGGSPTQGIASPTNELFFGDARWVILTFGCMIFFAALCFSRRYRLKVFQDPSTGLFFSVIISYLVWMAEFSIQRYLAPVDILCGAAILFLFLQLPKAFLRLGGMLAVSVVCWLILKVPDSGHLPWRSYWQAINPKPLQLHHASLIFLTGKPSSYVAASLSRNAIYAGISGDFDLHAEAHNRLARQLSEALRRRPALALKEIDQGSVPGVSASILASYGLTATRRCQPLHIADECYRICDVERRQ